MQNSIANPEPSLSSLREELRELGYLDGKNILFELRSAAGKPNLLPDLAAELARLEVDIYTIPFTLISSP